MHTSPQHNSITVETLEKQVGREILSSLVPQGIRRRISSDSPVAFDSSLIWWIVDGAATFECNGKQVCNIALGDILGPWLSSASPLRLRACEESNCEMLGFRQDVIWKVLSLSPQKMRLWAQFQTATCSNFFGQFVDLKTYSVAPVPEYRHYSPGETIIIEGQEGQEVFVLTDGAAMVSVHGDTVGEIHRD